MDQKSSEPKLSRAIQSREILEKSTEAEQETPPPKRTPAAAAVKTKAVPPPPKFEEPKTEPKAEARDESPRTPATPVQTPKMARAVAECLNRSSTHELLNQATPQSAKAVTPNVPNTLTPSPVSEPKPKKVSESSDEEDEEVENRKAAAVLAKREAHARYMRFSRSLTSSWVSKNCGGGLLHQQHDNHAFKFNDSNTIISIILYNKCWDS